MTRARRRAGRTSVALAVALAVAADGCGGRPPLVSLADRPRAYRARDYETVLERWTRSGELLEFQGLDFRLGVTATYLSRDFRAALLARQAEEQRMAPADRARLAAAAREAAARAHEFYVALTTQNVRWGELSRPSSAWHLTLVDDEGRAVRPERIERVRRVGAQERADFPYTTPWRQVFRVYFPAHVTDADGNEVPLLEPGTRFFILRFAGPLGTLDLRWDVARDG